MNVFDGLEDDARADISDVQNLTGFALFKKKGQKSKDFLMKSFSAFVKERIEDKCKIRHVPRVLPLSEADFSLQLFADGAPDGAGAVGDEGADDGRGGDEEFSRLIKGRYKDAYTRRTQNIINRRFRETKELEEFKGRAEPLIERLFKEHKVDSGDFDALESRLFGTGGLGDAAETADGVGNDNGAERGGSGTGAAGGSNIPAGGKEADRDRRTDGGEAVGKNNGADGKQTFAENSRDAGSDGLGGDEGNSDAALASAERVRGQITDSRRRSMAENIYCAWLGEAEALAEYYPDFDLGSECSNPAFTAMISSGVSMKEAYEAVHHRELLSGAMKYTADKVAGALWQSVLTGASRPSENGLYSRGVSLEKKSAEKLTDRDIKNILRRVEKGEKVRF